MSDLRTGSMVRLWQRRDKVPIKARYQPKRIVFVNRKDDNKDPNVICDIPAGAQALYMGSHRDALTEAMAKKGRGPFNFFPRDVLFHLVLWGERPVWVSSEDCELKDITEGDDGLPPA